MAVDCGDQSGRVAKRHELETRQKRTEAVAILDHGRKTNDRNVWWGVFNRASFFCAARAVFRTLENYVSLGEIRDVIHVLPEEILTLWPPLQLPMWSSEAPLSNR
jgi:hypothetical protein